MELIALTLILLAGLGAHADEQKSATAQEGQVSFSSTVAPKDWPNPENFTTGARGDVMDVIDSVIGDQRLPASANAGSN